MIQVGVLQGTTSNNENFPYTTWKSELDTMNNLQIDFVDWIVDSDPISTFYNILFSNFFDKRINDCKFTKPIRSVYCSCFKEYRLLLSESSEKLYKRISILEQIISAAFDKNINNIIVPITCNDAAIVTQKQIDNIVFIIRFVLKHFKKDKFLFLESDLDNEVNLEILKRVDSENVKLSLNTNIISKMQLFEIEEIAPFLQNVSIDNGFYDFAMSYRNLSIISYSGNYLIKDKEFLENDLLNLNKWLKNP